MSNVDHGQIIVVWKGHNDTATAGGAREAGEALEVPPEVGREGDERRAVVPEQLHEPPARLFMTFAGTVMLTSGLCRAESNTSLSEALPGVSQ